MFVSMWCLCSMPAMPHEHAYLPAPCAAACMPPFHATHPPVRMHDREAQVVHNAVVVVVLVRRDLDPDGEALQTEVKIGADGALDARDIANVLATVVAVVQRPAWHWAYNLSNPCVGNPCMHASGVRT